MIKRIATGFALAVVLAGCGRVNPETAVTDAQELVAKGEAGEARILLKNALAKADNNVPGARQLLARIALDEGDPKAASDELAALDPLAANEPVTAALMARVAIDTGKLEDASKLLDTAGDKVPEPDRTLTRARLLRAQGREAEALAALRILQQAQPDNEALVIEIGENLVSMGNLAAAVIEMDRYLKDEKHPRAEALRLRGELFLRLGRNADGIKDLQAALKAAPMTWPKARHMSTELALGEALMVTGDTAAAHKQIEHIEKTYPGLVGTEILAARLDLLEGNLGPAVDRISRTAQAVPDNARLQYMLAEALMNSGNLAGATEVLEKRVAAEPATSPARQMLAKLLMKQGRPGRVVELLGNGADSSGETRDDLLEAARLSMRQANEAISTLSARIAKEPGNEQLRAQMAMAQVANGEPAEALITLGPMPTRGFAPEPAAARITALLITGNDLEANRFMDAVLDPSSGVSVTTLIATADAAQRQQRLSMVSRLLDRAAELDPKSKDVQLRRANVAFDLKNYDDSEKLLRELLRTDPQNLTAGVALGRVLEAKGDLDAARKALNEAAERLPKAPEPIMMLASMELRAGRIKEAGKAFDTLIALKPDGTLANATGLVLAGQNHFEEARARFRQAIEQDGKNALYWFNLGRTQISLTDNAAAKESFLKSLELQPSALPAASAAAQLSLEKKDFATAKRAASMVTTAAPNSAGAWLLQGQVLLAAGEAEAAINAFSRSTKVSANAPAAMGTFEALFKLKSDHADVPLVAWLSRQPSDVNARRVLSSYYLEKGDTRAARQQMETLLKTAPNDVATLNNLAWVLRSTDAARAETLALQAQAIAPGNPLVDDTLGMVYLAGGKTDAALATLARAAAAAPKSGEVQYHYALALNRAGKAGEARGVLRKALEGGGAFEGRSEAQALLEKLGK